MGVVDNWPIRKILFRPYYKNDLFLKWLIWKIIILPQRWQKAGCVDGLNTLRAMQCLLFYIKVHLNLLFLSSLGLLFTFYIILLHSKRCRKDGETKWEIWYCRRIKRNIHGGDKLRHVTLITSVICSVTLFSRLISPVYRISRIVRDFLLLLLLLLLL